jgi:hypothetical protein
MRSIGSGQRLEMNRTALGVVLVFASVVVLSVGFLSLPKSGSKSLPIRKAAVTAPVAVDQHRLGTNLREVAHWSTQMPFLNLFKQARPWFTQCEQPRDPDCDGAWDTGEAAELDLDPQGWVRSLPDPQQPGFSIAATVLALPASIPAGRYVMRYDGRGELRYRLGVRRIEAESVPGRDLLEFDPHLGPIHIQILATDPDLTGDYLRNLRLVREDRESLLLAGEPFNPDLLARLRPFEVLRFMEWMRTNGSPLVHWEQRARPEDATYTSDAGVPPEVMLLLANRLGVSVWLTLPHRADDQFVRRLAQLARESLRPSQRLYLEYSNEVWNSLFSQQDWVAEKAEALWPDPRVSAFTKTLNWYGKRSAEICGIWKSVFETEGDRVVCVMAGQAANPWVVQQALECPLWTGETETCAARGIDALAIANYFGGYLGRSANEAMLADWSAQGEGGLELLFRELEEGGLLPEAPEQGALVQASSWLQQHLAVSVEFGLPILGYEGGQHLVGEGVVVANDAVTDLFVSANRDPRMSELYRRYLSDWQSHSGALLMHFSDISEPGRYGSWGAVEQVGQRHSPKYDALRAYQAEESQDPRLPMPP